jgi:hypothetical protein
MIEYHGWAVIRESYDEKREDEYKANEVISAIRDRIKTFGTNEFYDLRNLNGSFHLIIEAAHNHRNDEIIEFFKWVANTSIGSYGLLYVHDDEDYEHGNENKFKVLRMKKGQVDEIDDVYLSPYFPTVEDPNPS